MQFDQTNDSQITSRITSIEQQRNNRHRYNIFINEQYIFSVHEDILVKHRLVRGEIIDQERVVSIIQADEQQKSYHDALKFIGRKPRSTIEVKRKLQQKGYEAEQIEKTIEIMTDQKYLDDEQFSKMWTEQRIGSQQRGRKWVEQELQQKGIAKEDIKQAIEAINEQDERCSAVKLAHKKWKQLEGKGPNRKQKVAVYLIRRGFASDLVRSVVNNIELSTNEQEDETGNNMEEIIDAMEEPLGE